MSKNIYITEGRKGRRFGSAKKLKTPLQGGGSCLWVPEDDVQLDPLFATENGVYIPDGYGFSDASVNVFDGNIGSLDADNNWPYFPDGDLDGYGKVDVNVPEEQQNTFTDAIQISTLGNDPNRPYSFVTFYSVSGDNYSTSGSTFYRSSFPPYVYLTEQGFALCVFIRGNGSLQTFSNWENISTGDPQQIPHAYLRQAVCTFNDSTPTGGHNGCPFRSSYVNGQDVFGPASQIDYAVLDSVGGHNAAVGNFGGIFDVYKQTSRWSDPGVSAFRYIKHVHIPVRDTQTYYYSSSVTEGDYRIIHGMPFQSGQEWLDYCRTH